MSEPTGQPRHLPGTSGAVRVEIVSVEGKSLSGHGHTHSVITAEDSTWTRGIHKFAYQDPKVHDQLYDIANSVNPEVIVIVWSGSTKVSADRQWITAVHELPSRSQGSREMRVETADMLWALNRTKRTLPRRGVASALVADIATRYGMKSQCVSDTFVTYIQSRETDFEFLTQRMRTRILTPYPQRGDFRLQVRSTTTGDAYLCFAPFRTPNTHNNWWYLNISDPTLGIHGKIEFVNQVPIRTATGASGVRVIVMDPYHRDFYDVQSPDFRALEATKFQNSEQKALSEAGGNAVVPFQYTVCNTSQEVATDAALALATGVAEAARMGNYEAVFTINGQPWFIPGDRVTLLSAAPTPSNLDWFVQKCETTICEGACNTHVIMVTDEPQIKQNGIAAQPADSTAIPNQPFVPATAPQPEVRRTQPFVRVIPSDGSATPFTGRELPDGSLAPTGLGTAANDNPLPPLPPLLAEDTDASGGGLLPSLAESAAIPANTKAAIARSKAAAAAAVSRK